MTAATTRDDLPGDDREAVDKEQRSSQDTAPDPYDIEALRTDDLADDVETADRLLTVAVRRPGTKHFFRVHPDPAYSLPTLLLAQKLDLGEEVYLVAPQLRDHLRTELPDEIGKYRLFTAMNRYGVLFLWPAKLPSADGGGRIWQQSALAAAERAKVAWIRMKGDRAAGAYTITEAMGTLPEPQWPALSMQELVKLAFADRMIASLDHDVLRELRGEI
jgi:hypothetical protein